MALMAVLVLCAPKAPSAPAPSRPLPSKIIADLYEERSLLNNEGFVLFCGQETERAAAYLGLTDCCVPTMLSMWHRESGFRVVHGDDKKSFGVTQTIVKRQKHWRKFWRDRGVELGTLADPSTQVFFGVAEFYECLKMAKGDEFDAVRRYNGSGKAAKIYAVRVFDSRKNIFHIALPATPAARAAYAEVLNQARRRK